MKISNFSVNPAICALGDKVNLSFTVTVESGDEVNGLTVTVLQPCQALIYWDREWRLSAGQSADLSVQATIPATPDFQKLLSENRSAEITNLDIQLGNYGAVVNMDLSLTVLDAWYRPSISRFELERGTDGLPDDEGETLLADALLLMSDAARQEHMTLRLYYAENAQVSLDSDWIDLHAHFDALLAGVEGEAGLCDRSFAKTSNWQFMLWLGDAFESVSALREISRSFANVHLSGSSTGGVCFGGFSSAGEDNPMFQCYYPAHFYGGIAGVTDWSGDEIPTGGRWLDGRMIYRRIVTLEVPAESNGVEKVVSSPPIEDFGCAVQLSGMLHRPTGFNRPLFHYRNTSDFMTAAVQATGAIDVYATHGGVLYLDIHYVKNT